MSKRNKIEAKRAKMITRVRRLIARTSRGPIRTLVSSSCAFKPRAAMRLERSSNLNNLKKKLDTCLRSSHLEPGPKIGFELRAGQTPWSACIPPDRPPNWLCLAGSPRPARQRLAAR